MRAVAAHSELLKRLEIELKKTDLEIEKIYTASGSDQMDDTSEVIHFEELIIAAFFDLLEQLVDPPPIRADSLSALADEVIDTECVQSHRQTSEPTS